MSGDPAADHFAAIDRGNVRRETQTRLIGIIHDVVNAWPRNVRVPDDLQVAIAKAIVDRNISK